MLRVVKGERALCEWMGACMVLDSLGMCLFIELFLCLWVFVRITYVCTC